MLALLDNPAIPIALVAVATAFVFGSLGRAPYLVLCARLAPPLAFLAAYCATYQKVPGFPPVGATNKIFYCVGFTLIATLVLDRLASGRVGRGIVAGVASIATTVWIGWPRLVQVDGALVLALIALSCIGAAITGWLTETARGSANDGQGFGTGSAEALARLAAISAVFAPVALFGGSSTSLALCVGLAIAFAVLSVLAIAFPRDVGVTGILPGGIGLLAIIDTVVLITQRTDVVGLVLVVASPCLGWLALRGLSARLGDRPWLSWFAGGLASLLPLPLVVALMFFSHESPF